MFSLIKVVLVNNDVSKDSSILIKQFMLFTLRKSTSQDWLFVDPPGISETRNYLKIA